MPTNNKLDSINLQKALFNAVMNHPEAQREGLKAKAACQPLPAKDSGLYKHRQNIQQSAFLNAGKKSLLQAVLQANDAIRRAGKELDICREAGLSKAETAARSLLAGATVLEFKAEERVEFSRLEAELAELEKNEQPSTQHHKTPPDSPKGVEDISDEYDGYKPS